VLRLEEVAAGASEIERLKIVLLPNHFHHHHHHHHHRQTAQRCNASQIATHGLQVYPSLGNIYQYSAAADLLRVLIALKPSVAGNLIYSQELTLI
jgi:hypothetical protein